MKSFKEYNKNIKVFLGGTCNDSIWRDELIQLLQIDYFNPVVSDWNEDAKQVEIIQREECDYCLYVITPKLKGFYSIAEATEDSIKRPEKTIFCYLNRDGEYLFDKQQLHSLQAVSDLIKRNGGRCFSSLTTVAEYLNNHE